MLIYLNKFKIIFFYIALCQPIPDPQYCAQPVTQTKPQQSPISVASEPPSIYLLFHNNHSIYCIKRNNQPHFIQKNLGQVFYNNTNTFNGICWNHKVEKVPATPQELKLVREHDSSEQNLKKSNLISLQTLTQLCDATKRPDILTVLNELLNTMVCEIFLYWNNKNTHCFFFIILGSNFSSFRKP